MNSTKLEIILNFVNLKYSTFKFQAYLIIFSQPSTNSKYYIYSRLTIEVLKNLVLAIASSIQKSKIESNLNELSKEVIKLD